MTVFAVAKPGLKFARVRVAAFPDEHVLPFRATGYERIRKLQRACLLLCVTRTRTVFAYVFSRAVQTRNFISFHWSKLNSSTTGFPELAKLGWEKRGKKLIDQSRQSVGENRARTRYLQKPDIPEKRQCQSRAAASSRLKGRGLKRKIKR